MIKKSRTNRTHVSPGVYFKEVEVPYTTKSMGITKLGLAGETLKGPAFQPISIENWRDFQTYFGGTSTEKFRGSKYPKYELPYIGINSVARFFNKALPYSARDAPPCSSSTIRRPTNQFD